MSSSRTLAYMVWLITSIFYAYQYVIRVMPSIMMEEMMQQFHLDVATFGYLSGFYYLGYSLAHIPIGLMLDRVGPKIVMSVCMLFVAVGMTPMLFSDHWLLSIIGRTVVGIGSSAAILGLFKVIRMSFVEERFPRMLSFSIMIGLIGAIYGGAPLHYVSSAIGAKATTELLIVAGLILAIATYFVVPALNAKEHSESVMDDIKQVLTNKRVLICCFSAGLMVGPVEGFADVWGPTFLKKIYGYDIKVASALSSLIFIGMCFGSPVLTFIADKVKKYLLTIVGCGVIMTALYIILCFTHMTMSSITVSFSVIGVCCAYQILAVTQATKYVTESHVGLTSALANMIIMMFGYAFHSIIGALIAYNGGMDNPAAFKIGVMFIPFAMVLGSLGFTYLAKAKA